MPRFVNLMIIGMRCLREFMGLSRSLMVVPLGLFGNCLFVVFCMLGHYSCLFQDIIILIN